MRKFEFLKKGLDLCSQSVFMKPYLLLAYLLCLASLPAHAQDKKAIDSLMHIYNNTKHDTAKILLLASIAHQYANSRPDTCITLAQQSLSKSSLIGFKQGIARNANTLAIVYRGRREWNLASDYQQRSLKIYEQMGDKYGNMSSLMGLGLIDFYQNKYTSALNYQLMALKLAEELDKKQEIASCLNNIGNIHYKQHNNELALEYYQKSLSIREQIKDKIGTANSLGSLAIIYKNEKKYELALENYQKALQVFQEMNDKIKIATVLEHIGNVYELQKKYELALEYQAKSMQVSEKIGDKEGIVHTLRNFANIYYKQGNYDKALEYAEKSIQIAQQINDWSQIEQLNKLFYKIYKENGDYQKALTYYETYKNIYDSLYDIEKQKQIMNLESKAQVERKQKEIELLNKNKELLEKDNVLQRIESERQKNAKLAIEKQAEAEHLFALANEEKSKRRQDSLFILAQKAQLEADNAKAKEKQLQAESKARQMEILTREQQIKIEKEAKEFQQYINYLVVAGLISVIIFAYFIYRSRQKEKKAKEIITKQKEEVLQQKEEITQMNEELNTTLQTVNEQKNEIEHKNKAIEDSINYAQRIQRTILPLEEYLKQYLQDYFIFFQPKDVVSGDFYYFEERNNKLFIAAIDCTGHGVPGAFMTMIASEILNEIIQNKAILEANEVLNELHKRVRVALKQTETKNRDGMDLVLLVVEPQKKVVHFAGAKNPLIYIQNGELYQIKGDKMPIGGEQREQERLFSQHTLDISVPTTFYLFSDGLQDQFGGADSKKFMIGQLKNLLLEIHTQEMHVQKELIHKAINDWMKIGNEKQIDDMLLWGIKM